MKLSCQPLALDHAGAWRVYLGGSQIRALRGQTGTADDHYPEEWIASTTEAKGAGAVAGAGLSRPLLQPDTTLLDLIQAEPEAYLGKAFVAKYGPQPGVLLKLLDAAQRLNVQIHLSREEARKYLGSNYGKAECWHFLKGRSVNGQPPCIYLGLKEHVTKELWRDVFERGNPQEILDCMYCFPAVEGETVFVESGIPHAIGPGCLLMELQEPSDITLRMERITPTGEPLSDELCHMGIGYDAMFDCIRYDHMTEEQTREAFFVKPKLLSDTDALRHARILDYDRCPYFAFDRMEVRQSFTSEAEPAFSGLMVLSGEGTLTWDGGQLALVPGGQYFLPAGIPFSVTAQAGESLVLIRFFGPEV